MIKKSVTQSWIASLFLISLIAVIGYGCVTYSHNANTQAVPNQPSDVSNSQNGTVLLNADDTEKLNNEKFNDAQAKVQKSALLATELRMQAEQLDSNLDAYDLDTLRQAVFNEEMYQANQSYYAQSFSSLDFMHKAGNRAIEHYDQLGAEVKRALLSGEKVIIVAHSQGNYIAQGIYANLVQDMAVNANLANNLQFVGVANVAGSTPSNAYITHDEDQAVYGLHAKIQGGQPLVANFKASFANGEPLGGFWESQVQRQNDIQNHGFVETYLSARFDKQNVFTPHYPEIVWDTNLPPRMASSSTIYGIILNKVNTGLDRLLGV